MAKNSIDLIKDSECSADEIVQNAERKKQNIIVNAQKKVDDLLILTKNETQEKANAIIEKTKKELLDEKNLKMQELDSFIAKLQCDANSKKEFIIDEILQIIIEN